MSSCFFAGLEENDSIRKHIYHDTDVILICFSFDSEFSFGSITTKWIPDVERFCPKGIVISQSLLTVFLDL